MWTVTAEQSEVRTMEMGRGVYTNRRGARTPKRLPAGGAGAHVEWSPSLKEGSARSEYSAGSESSWRMSLSRQRRGNTKLQSERDRCR